MLLEQQLRKVQEGKNLKLQDNTRTIRLLQQFVDQTFKEFIVRRPCGRRIMVKSDVKNGEVENVPAIETTY